MKKVILASVALLAVFASCQKEDIRTVYETEPAHATIQVNVFDAFLGKDVTSLATVTSSVGGVQLINGKWEISIIGDKTIGKQTVNITAKYQDRSNTIGFEIASLIEGAVADYACTVTIGSPKETVDFDFSYVDVDTDYIYGYLENATHEYNKQSWCINDSEYVLYGETNYIKKTGTFNKVVLTEDAADAEITWMDNVIKNQLMVPDTSVDTKYEYVVSAFSYFNVEVKYTIDTDSYEFFRVFTSADGKYKSKEIFGTADIDDWSTSVKKLEIASPTHASHYVAGHGVDDPSYSHYDHGHGHGGSNAGGGIIVAD